MTGHIDYKKHPEKMGRHKRKPYGKRRLTAEQVRAIKADPRPASAIAKDYDMATDSIYNILYYHRYGHIV